MDENIDSSSFPLEDTNAELDVLLSMFQSSDETSQRNAVNGLNEIIYRPIENFPWLANSLEIGLQIVQDSSYDLIKEGEIWQGRARTREYLGRLGTKFTGNWKTELSLNLPYKNNPNKLEFGVKESGKKLLPFLNFHAAKHYQDYKITLMPGEIQHLKFAESTGERSLLNNLSGDFRMFKQRTYLENYLDFRNFEGQKISDEEKKFIANIGANGLLKDYVFWTPETGSHLELRLSRKWPLASQKLSGMLIALPSSSNLSGNRIAYDFENTPIDSRWKNDNLLATSILAGAHYNHHGMGRSLGDRELVTFLHDRYKK